MKIAMVGMGVVGTATACGLERGHELLYYDKYKDMPNTLKEIAEQCEIIFVTVPTPMKKSGEIDLSAIHESIGILNEYAIKKDEKQIIVIRSTAVSGTTDSLSTRYEKFDFVFNPEFLTDRNAKEDFLNSKRIVIGANNKEVAVKIAKVYTDALFNCPIIYVDIKTSEMIKYCSNIFLASQISVANELYEICKLLNIDWEEIRSTLEYDNRIGTFTKVPGDDGDRSFGGKCLVKDLNALIYLARENGYIPDLLEEVWRTNLKFRKNYDWLDKNGGIE